MTLHKKRANF